MLRHWGALILAIMLVAAAPIPKSTPSRSLPTAEQGKPKAATNNPKNDKPSTGDQSQAVKSKGPPKAGLYESAPLYVKANCEHGCGYAEDSKGFWQKVTTEPGNLFALAVALFTLGLVGTSTWTNLLVAAQVKLGRDEFLATHRPKIRVRQFRNVPTNPGENYEIHFLCANVGDSPCDILEISYQTRTRQILTAKNEIDRPVLVPGEFRHILLHPDTKLAPGELCPFQAELFRLEWNGNKDWDFAGYVRYRDHRKIERVTGFWQRFDHVGFPVATPENPNFRYED